MAHRPRLSRTPAVWCLLHTDGHLRVVSWSLAHPAEFALGRGEERVLLFARTRFGRFVPMLRRPDHAVARMNPGAVSRVRLNGYDFADPPRLRLEEPFPESNRPLTSSVTTTARSRRLHRRAR
jgi:hypothetical protein